MARKRSPIQRFEDLQVWQASRELVKWVYHAARTQPLKRDPSLVDQMQRAAVSVSSNLAEGHERGSRVQYVEYCFIAKGSAGELRSQVINAHDVGLLDDNAYAYLYERCLDVSRLLGGYIKHLLESCAKVPGSKFTRAADRDRPAWEEFLADHGIRQLPDGQCVLIDPVAESAKANLQETDAIS